MEEERESIRRGKYDEENFYLHQITNESDTENQKIEKDNKAESTCQEEEKSLPENSAGKQKKIAGIKKDVYISLMLFLVIAGVGMTAFLWPKRVAGNVPNHTKGQTQETDLELPNLISSDRDEAQEQITALGLVFKIEEEENLDIPDGIVVNQMPIAGAPVKMGESVVITINKGLKQVKVPYLCNKKKKEAKGLLESVGLCCEVKEIFSDTVAKGIVVSQSVAVDESVPKDSAVIISVSKGKEKTEEEAQEPDTSAVVVQQPVISQEQPAEKLPSNGDNKTANNKKKEKPKETENGADDDFSDDWGNVGEDDFSDDWGM